MIAKQVSKSIKKPFFKGYQMQPWAKFDLFYKLRYVMNRCFTSEETLCKYQMRVKYTKCECKIPNASKKYQMWVRNTKLELKIPNANEKYQTRVKNTKLEWKIPNASEKCPKKGIRYANGWYTVLQDNISLVETVNTMYKSEIKLNAGIKLRAQMHKTKGPPVGKEHKRPTGGHRITSKSSQGATQK